LPAFAETLAIRDSGAYIGVILIGFAGRTKQQEWAENPLFFFGASCGSDSRHREFA
jgi:hypothetical protein